jgi:hypothetical protein
MATTKSSSSSAFPPKKPLPLTSIPPRGVTVERLASVIVARVRLDERANALSPKKAKALRASEGALALARQESELWKWLCAGYADFLLMPAVKGRGESRSEVVAKRLCDVLTSLSAAIVDQARKGLRSV